MRHEQKRIDTFLFSFVSNHLNYFLDSSAQCFFRAGQIADATKCLSRNRWNQLEIGLLPLSSEQFGSAATKV